MPYPFLALAALAASAAGTGAQMASQSEARSAQQAAVSAENRRQGGYRQQAQQVVDQSIAGSGRDAADPAIAAAAAARANRFNAIINQVQAPPTGNTINRSIPTATGTATAQPGVSASAAAWNRILGGAQAKLGAYNDWGLARNIAAKRAGQQLSTIGTNAAHSADLLQSELADASHAGDGLATAGSVLGALGSVAGAYGSVGGGGAGVASPGFTGAGQMSIPTVPVSGAVPGHMLGWGELGY